MSKLVIFGAGGHGVVVADAARCAGRWSEVYFYDDRWPGLNVADGLPVIGDAVALRQQVARGWPAQQQLVVAIGDNALRLALSQEFLQCGVALATVVHPTAVVSQSVRLAPGSVVFARAVINPRSTVGMACIINTGAIVEHDAQIARGSHLCPGAALAGNVTVDELVTIGIGSCVVQGRRIGDRATIGAGSVVIRDVEAGAKVAGNPAKKILK